MRTYHQISRRRHNLFIFLIKRRTFPLVGKAGVSGFHAAGTSQGKSAEDAGVFNDLHTYYEVTVGIEPEFD